VQRLALGAVTICPWLELCEAEVVLHDWSIEPREYLRQEQRRGKRHAFNSVDPERVALVVVDMISFFIEENPYARGIVPNVRRLADSVRVTGGVVAWILPATDAPDAARIEFLGDRVAAVYQQSGGQGSLRDRLWSEFEVAADDLVVEKRTVGAFFPDGCDLHSLLAERGVDTVLVAGTVANVCCESTVREAANLGYRTIMVADANAATRDADLNATLHTVYRSFGDVRPVSEIIQLLERSGNGAHPMCSL